MKYICICVIVTMVIILSSCFKDPPAVTAYMYYKETLCNDPWGKAPTTNSDTVAAYLTAHKISFSSINIHGNIFPGAEEYKKCDTLTGRQIVTAIFFTDTAKASVLGFYRYY